MRDGQASLTAQRVAAHRATFERVATPWGRPDADDALHADVAAGLRRPVTGMARYLRARTAFLDRVVVSALDRGVDQAVVAGAGYDGRSLRYGRPGVRWFELDHPATQADKRARLDRLGVDTGDVAFVAADFTTDDVGAALAEAGVDPDRPALFLCEGVAGYLAGDVLTGLLRALAGAAGPRSVLAMSVPLAGGDGTGPRRGALAEVVARIGEPLLWSVPADGLGPFLAGAGWTVDRAVAPDGEPVAPVGRSAFVIALSGGRAWSAPPS
jgi:methyltransferase (TIGR00027 family)